MRHIKSLKKSSTGNSIKISSSSSSISSLPDAKKTSTAAKNGRNGEACNLEFFFRRTYPWQSVYLPTNVDRAFEELLSPVIQEYILTWYSKISKDDGLIFEIKNLFRHILANLIVRCKELDLNHFLVYKTNTLVYNHLSDFIQVYKSNPELIEHNAAKLKALTPKERIDKQFAIFKATMQKSTEPFNHFALSSRRNELAYLRKMCSQVLPFLLPDSIIKCRASYELVQEIAVSILLLPVLDIISRPTTINKLISNMLREGESLIIKKSSAQIENQNRIQLLKHWSQMNGCIFKSIQTPSFNELIENNEHLCIFINYLNSMNSLSILQFYLMIKDILKTYNELASANEEGQGSNANSPNVASQIEELKAWSKNNRSMLEAISFDYKTSYYSLLSDVISTDSINDEITKKILQKTYLELNNLIRETYYTSFIKSDFIYKNLYGLQRLNSTPQTKSPISQRKNNKQESLLSPPMSGSSISAKLESSLVQNEPNSNNKEDTFSLSNNDIEMDDFDYKPASDGANKGDLPTAGVTSTGTGVSGENDDEDEPEIADDFDVETYSTGSAKLSSEVRLDLINEINDEFLDEVMGTDKPQQSVFGQQFSIEDEEENITKKPLDLTSLINENEEEEEAENEDDDANLNLGNLRVTIDGLDEITVGENAGYAFVISVWNLDPKLIAKSSGDTPSWFVKRKYDEFYVLDSRLRQFHGGSLMNIGTANVAANRPLSTFQLPPKPRAILSFSNKENNLDYLESVQNDFERYLQSLLSNPILSKSKLIKSFLDPARIEFNSSLLNNITNIGKMVKGVPYKLRVERGQSLDSFLAYLFKTIRQHKPKSSQTSVVYEDITEKSLNVSEFSNPEKNKTLVKKTTSPLNNNTDNSNEYLVSPFESFMFLIRYIYILPNFICLLFFSLRKLIDKLFDYIIYWFVSRKVNELTTPEAIEQFILLLKEVIFDKEEPKNENYYESAYKSLNSFITKNKLYALAQKIIAEDLFKSTFEDGTILFLEAFQYPILNKNLIYKLLDALMIELFPELSELNNQPKTNNNNNGVT